MAFDFPTPGAVTPGFRDRSLFRPERVLLWGEAGRPAALRLAENLAGGGFKGQLHAVGLDAPGLAAAASLEALPATPQLACLALPPDRLPAAFAALARRGTHAAIVFGEAPPLGELAAASGVRALGPESFGLAIPSIGLNATLGHLPVPKGRLALVGQSAGLARAVLDWAAGLGLGFSLIAGIGDNTDLGFAAALDWIARDPEAGAVLLDVRQIKSRRAFISAARAAARTRPVLAIRPGAHASDPQAAAVMRAAFRRAGVLLVDGLEAWLDGAETLARARPRPGGAAERIAVLANGGGLAWAALDALRVAGGTRATPAGGNPRVLAEDCGAALGEAAAALATEPEVDQLVVLHAPCPGEDEVATAAALAAAAKAPRAAPILIGWTGGAAGRGALLASGLAVFASPEGAMRGALTLAEDRRNRLAAQELPPREVLELAPDRTTVRRLFAAARAEGRLALREDEALAVLAAYGLPSAPHRAVPGAAEAADAAALLGFPVVLKALSPDLPRKTDVGGVALGLRDAAAVAAAAGRMAARIARERPQARLDGFLVQRQAAPGHELRLRLEDDPVFGPWIGFGRGGTAAELLADEACDLPPLNRPLAEQLVARTRGAALLDGYRDWPAVDRRGLADALVRLSQLVVDFPEIARAGINPLLADSEGLAALDGEITLRVPAAEAEFAIPPYPAELARPWRGKRGPELTIRPIRPEDAAAHAEMFRRFTPEDVRYRFFTQMRELPPEQIARLTQIDYGREMAFVAVEERADQPDRSVGVSRLVREPGGRRGEFAVIVDPAWKGTGLARHLMERLFEWGRAQGMVEIVGQVLADNAPMLGFVKSLGFETRRDAEDPEVVEARRAL